MRPLALAAGTAFVLVSCQSQGLQEGLQPPTSQETADSGVAAADSIALSNVLIQGLTLSPTSATLAPGGTVTFIPYGWLASGPPPIIASVTWSATGGTITSGGTYTAGSTPGTYAVKAKSTTTWNEETAVITISGTAPTVTNLTVTPASVTLAAGATAQFKASATLSNGTTQTSPVVSWNATGGTISSSGLYTAGTAAGTYRVIGSSTNGKRDTSAVTITSGSTTPTVTAITLTPSTASLTTGATQQFAATATLSNGTTQAASVNWSATGGTITSGGLYTAGSTAGSYRVIAVQQGGTRADTSAISLTTSTSGSGTGMYPNRPGSYTKSTAIDFSQAVPPSPDNVDRAISGAPGWYMIYFGNSWSQRADATAPQSAPTVWNGNWPAGSYGGGVIGQGGGHGIGNIFNSDPKGSSRVYLSMRVYFDFDASQWHPISNKFVNLETDAGLILVQLMEGGYWRHAEELTSNGKSFWIDRENLAGMVDNRAVPTRKWVQIEVLIDLPNHIFKVWQDGVLTTNAAPQFSATRITTVAWDAFRGGGGETLTTPLNYRYDHFMIAW